METFLTRIEALVFRHRLSVLLLFIITTCYLVFQASQIKLDASFNKNIPLNHEYMNRNDSY